VLSHVRTGWFSILYLTDYTFGNHTSVPVRQPYKSGFLDTSTAVNGQIGDKNLSSSPFPKLPISNRLSFINPNL